MEENRYLIHLKESPFSGIIDILHFGDVFLCEESPLLIWTGGFLHVKFSEGFTAETFSAEFFTVCIDTCGCVVRDFPFQTSFGFFP